MLSSSAGPGGMSPGYYDMNAWGIPAYTPTTAATNSLTLQAKNAGDLGGVQTASQLMQAALDANNLLPQELSLTNSNPLFAGLTQVDPTKAEDYYMQMYAAPAEGQLQSDLYGSGRMNSSFGGAELGQLKAMNLLNKLKAGEDIRTRVFDQSMQRINAFYNNGVGTAQKQNQLGVNQAQAIAQLKMQSQDSANQYNANMYNNMLQAQNQRANMFNQGVQNNFQQDTFNEDKRRFNMMYGGPSGSRLGGMT